ncbi:hypothetical protein CHLRE_17g736550v5 [Chlamydomonas reinhardtii]|uniref:Uncharacterized protein n=1 Tax=Chlamydomonas reinhardtii TaxID=3055 RepID=A0A2K3CRF3_CHLRE|nr:uncharacterized protein CHLRE_17g736550v5 [Chlamydomonas reinhardtii]PNW70861.1 hypothetical protein CHLRE_17g736550v5 [Chlamydomonas reinhardtii]
MITGTLCLLALIVALAPPGLCRPVHLDIGSGQADADRNALETVTDFATDSSQLLETPEDSELSSSGRMTCRSWTAAAAPPAYSTCASSTPSICNAHDLCYRCRINWGLGTAWCDAMLLRRCKDVCHANWPNWWDWWHRGFCQGTCDTMNVGLTWYSVRANNERSERRSNDCWPSWRPYLERPFSVGKPSNRCNNMASC